MGVGKKAREGRLVYSGGGWGGKWRPRLLPVDTLEQYGSRPALQHGVEQHGQQLGVRHLDHGPAALLHQQTHLLEVTRTGGEGQRRASAAVLGREELRRGAAREHPAECLPQGRGRDVAGKPGAQGALEKGWMVAAGQSVVTS